MSAAVRVLPEPGASSAAAHRVAPDIVGVDAAERPITVDQTNVSVVVGEAVVVKWLRPPLAPPSATVTMLRHLGAAGFTEMPTFHGAVTDDMVRAMVTAFIPGALDGWDWFVDELSDGLDSGSLDVPLASAAAVGALAARLHVALATPTAVIAEPIAVAPVTTEHEFGIALLDDALACTAGPEGERLAGRAGQIRAAVDALASVGEVPVQHVHGDLHVGQILRADSVMVVNDFDGDPVAPPHERHRRRSAMVDLAALIQSVDHVGRIVAKRRPEHRTATLGFIAEAVDRVERGYRSVRPAQPDDAVLLRALRTVQELHEFVYAAQSLPRWLYVPDAALTAMFPKVVS